MISKKLEKTTNCFPCSSVGSINYLRRVRFHPPTVSGRAKFDPSKKNDNPWQSHIKLGIFYESTSVFCTLPGPTEVWNDKIRFPESLPPWTAPTMARWEDNSQARRWQWLCDATNIGISIATVGDDIFSYIYIYIYIYIIYIIYIWWLVVWNMAFIFPYIGNNDPNRLIFVQRGWNHQPVAFIYSYIYIYIQSYVWYQCVF